MDHQKENVINWLPADARQVDFYAGDDGLAIEISRVLCIAIDQKHGAIAVATPDHQRAIDRHLENRGIDVATARLRGQYSSYDAGEILEKCSIDGVVDEEHIAAVLAGILEPMFLRFPKVSIFAEVVALLWTRGRHDAAVDLEKIWNQIVRTQPRLLYCAYPSAALADPECVAAFRQVCLEHCKVLETEGPKFRVAL